MPQERDRLQRELLQLQIRAEAADDLRSQNDALSQELSRAREEIERLRACESKSFHPFTISSMHQSSEESKPDSRAEVDVEVTPAFHFSQLLSLSNGWGPEGKEEEGGGGETIRSWSVSPEEGRDWLREREEEAEGLQRALLGEEQWTPSGIDDDTMTTLSASTGNPRCVLGRCWPC